MTKKEMLEVMKKQTSSKFVCGQGDLKKVPPKTENNKKSTVK